MLETMETEENITNDEWKYWCRLCAKDGALSINLHAEQQQTAAASGSNNLNIIRIIDFLEEVFRINIKENGSPPQLLCKHCFALVQKLAMYVDHVREVQSMYDTIRITGEWKPMDLKMLRDKCVLQENDIYTLKTAPQHNDCTTKSAIEKVFVDDIMDAVGSNLPNTIVKTELIVDEVAKTEMNEYEEGDDDVDDDDPFADDVTEVLASENIKSLDRQSKLDISKNIKVELIEEADEKKPLRTNRNNTRAKADNDARKADNDAELKSKPSKTCDQELIKNNEEKKKVRVFKKKSIPASAEKNDKKLANNNTCVECSIFFPQACNYRAHMRKQHGIIDEPLKCPECPKTFESTNKLNRHTKMHRPAEEKRVYPCPQCDKKFQSKDYVAKHIKFVHEDVRAFICEECGEAVRTEATLREHMLIHTDYAPFVCKICEKGFKNQYRLKTHMEIHSCNKYICSECGLQLNSRVTLSRHMLVHSDVSRHKCEYCGRAFKRAKSLKSHLILHSGLRPYSCNFCEKTFANGANCRSHKRRAHPEELAELEAAGGKTYTKNIPKLEVLKAVTRSAENLLPVVTKQSGNFSSGKRPKLSTDCTDGTKASKIHKNDADNVSPVGNQSSEKVLTTSLSEAVATFNEKNITADSLTTSPSNTISPLGGEVATFNEKLITAGSLTTTSTLNTIPPTMW